MDFSKTLDDEDTILAACSTCSRSGISYTFTDEDTPVIRDVSFANLSQSSSIEDLENVPLNIQVLLELGPYSQTGNNFSFPNYNPTPPLQFYFFDRESEVEDVENSSKSVVLFSSSDDDDNEKPSQTKKLPSSSRLHLGENLNKQELRTKSPSPPSKKRVACVKPVDKSGSNTKKNGFERGLKVDYIAGAARRENGDPYFVVFFKNRKTADVIPREICNLQCPSEVITFYEKHLIFKKADA